MKSGLPEVSVVRRRKAALVVAVLIAAAGVIWRVHDAVPLALLVCAAGLIWSTREWKAWVLAALMVAAGLVWSSLDARRCSVWWRGKIVYGKLSGQFPYVGWKDINRSVYAPCVTLEKPDPRIAGGTKLLREKRVEGRKWELYETELGRFWLTAPGKKLLMGLVWEVRVQSVYESREVAIRPGDTVIDCGAHVGVFTRYALQRGAGRVIAIEPDPTNRACLESNLAQEIADARVMVVKAGVWDKETHLTLWAFDEWNSGMKSFLRESTKAKRIEGLPVRPLDEIVKELELDRVDFIKMDIEGSERRALRGARKTISQFKPKMAIFSYHLADDAKVIPAIVKGIEPSYQIHAKDIERFNMDVSTVHTKVLFFR